MVDLQEIIQLQNSADCLYTAAQLDAAIDAMAIAIGEKLSTENPLCLCVLNGAIVVTGKLLPLLAFPLNIDSVNATRYGDKTVGDAIDWLYRPATSVVNRTILIIDDVLDHGITLAAVKEDCLNRGAKQVYIAVLVNKLIVRDKPVTADFIGVNAEDHYLFGYGMDYKGYLRNAPGLFACNF
ncbi:MAG TPA: hypoxanthine-guanine phosphoribosyltransferase [Crenotrichaceae bacterium]|nr:hypoxanthine-guanine phosphoribosyltransferase [Crenotrichaceae bacterium]